MTALKAVIEEVFASYVNLTRQGDSFFVAMHPLHIRVAEHVLKGKRVIATFFENRFDFTQTSLAADFLEHAENIITDSDYTTKLIMANLGAVNNKPSDYISQIFHHMIPGWTSVSARSFGCRTYSCRLMD